MLGFMSCPADDPPSWYIADRNVSSSHHKTDNFKGKIILNIHQNNLNAIERAFKLNFI
jgi:hypothetical protein